MSAPALEARVFSATEMPAMRRPHVIMMLGKSFILVILARGLFWSWTKGKFGAQRPSLGKCRKIGCGVALMSRNAEDWSHFMIAASANAW